MPLAQDIYNTLVKDPDLDIGENQTREEAAKSEADFRARQHVNNVKALSLATEPLEKVSPIKALLQHVSSISKTVVSGSISIAQNILKISSQEEATRVAQHNETASIFKSLLDNPATDEKTKHFINAYIKTQKGETHVGNAEKIAMFLEMGGKVDTILNAHTSDHPQAQKSLQVLGLVQSGGSGQKTTFGASLHQTLSKVVDEKTGKQVFAIPHKEFKPESSELGKKKGVDYGNNTSTMLNSSASLDKINSALGRQKSPYSVVFGGGGKLKLANKDGTDISTSNIHNPFPAGTHGRLFQSMAAFKAPTAGEQSTGHYDAASFSQHSVADILNAVHWISNQETPAQAQEVAEAHQAEEEAITEAGAFETKTLPPSTATTPPEEAGKAPFVMFGSWGYQKHGKHGMDAPHEVQFETHTQGLKHGICNELGQVNKVGQALIQASIKAGKLNKKTHYADFGTHMVLKSSGVKALCDHHGIDALSGVTAKSVAMEIAGMELMADELPDGLDWKSAMQAVFDKTPKGGVPETPKLQTLVEDTADELGVSPTPDPVGNAAKAAKASMKSEAARLQAAYASGDGAAVAKHAKGVATKSGIYNAYAGALGDDNALETALEDIDEDYHMDIVDKIMNNVPAGSAIHDYATDKLKALEDEQYGVPVQKPTDEEDEPSGTESVGASSSIVAESTAHATLEDKAKKFFTIHEHDYTGEGLSNEEIQEEKDQASQEMKDATNELASVTSPDAAEEAAKKYVTDNHQAHFGSSDPDSVNDWLEEKDVGGVVEADVSGPPKLGEDSELQGLVQDVATADTDVAGAADEASANLNTKIKELQDSGISSSDITDGIMDHSSSISGHSKEELESFGVEFPAVEEEADDAEKEADAAEEATPPLSAKDKAAEAINQQVAEEMARSMGISTEEAKATMTGSKEEKKAAKKALKEKMASQIAEEIAAETEGASPTPAGAKYDTQTGELLEASDKEPSVAEPTAEAPEEVPTPKGKAPGEKLDKVMTAHFGEDWEEQAKTDSDIGDVLESYEGEEGQKDLDSDYKKHHIEAIKNKAIEAKEDKVTAEEDSKQAEEDKLKEEAKESEEKLKEEANSLPSEPDDLDDMAKIDKKESVTPEVATAQARELLAHQKKHKDNMSSEAKNKLSKGLISAMKHGADIDQLKDEMDTEGDNFGSPEHLQEAHEKDMQKVAFKNKHEELVSGESGQQAREDAFHAGAHNKFTDFDEDGNPKHDVHVEADKNGKAHKFDMHYPKDYKDHGESQKKFHPDTGHALSDSHMLHELDPMQQKRHDEYKKATAEQHKATADYEKIKVDPNSSTEDMQKAHAKAKETDNTLASSRKALEDSGVPMKDVNNEDDTPKSGPPDPEVAKQKIAQGYVWHEETRHWILKDTLKELQGGHGSGNLMKIGHGKPPKGGAASNSTITGNALHSQLSAGGHLDAHNALTGISKIPNFTHPTKGSAGSSGIASKAAKDVPDSKLGSVMDNLKEGKGLGMTSFMDNLFKGYPMPKGSALSMFIKAYGSHEAMKHKKEVKELLERVSETEDEAEENSVEKGIIPYR